MNLGSQTARRQAEQPAPGACVQETFSVKRTQHSLERPFRGRDPLVVQQCEKSGPVIAELEPFASGDFGCMMKAHRTFTWISILSPDRQSVYTRLCSVDRYLL
jgi:hypothetical protein